MSTITEDARLVELRRIITGLSPREAIVLHALCREDLQNKAIARRAKCSVRTIESIRQRLYAAFGVHSPASLGVAYGEWRALDRIERGGDGEAAHHDGHEGHDAV